MVAMGHGGAAGGISEPSGASPPWPGVGLYSITKGCGAEVCRIFSQNHVIHRLDVEATPLEERLAVCGLLLTLGTAELRRQ